MAKLFLTLGVFSSLLTPTLYFGGSYAFVPESLIPEQTWWLLLMLALVLYVGTICFLGFRKTGDDRGPIERCWQECIGDPKT